MLAERLNKAGADLVSLTESIDTTSASGKMVYRMLSVLNEFQRDLIAEHTADALAFKASKGERFSRFAPFGYRFGHEGDLVKDEREQETIRQVHELRRRGLSIRKISAKLASKGVFNRNGKPLSPKAVFRILKTAACCSKSRTNSLPSSRKSENLVNFAVPNFEIRNPKF